MTHKATSIKAKRIHRYDRSNHKLNSNSSNIKIGWDEILLLARQNNKEYVKLPNRNANRIQKLLSQYIIYGKNS